MVAVDVCKAFESVNHSSMWRSTQESRKSMSQTITCCNTRCKRQSALERTDTEGGELNLTGGPEQRDPLGSLPFDTVLQLALDQHMQERKEKVRGVNLGEKNHEDVLSNPAQRSSVATWTLLFPFVGDNAEGWHDAEGFLGPLGPRIGQSEVTALLRLALRAVDPVARPPPAPFSSVRDACSTACGCFAVSHWAARSARALCHTATLRANLRFADDLRGNPTRKDDGRCCSKCWRARQRKTPIL